MSVQSGRPRKPRESPLTAMDSQLGVVEARVDSDITTLLRHQTANGLPETVKFLIEIKIAAHGCHGSRNIGAVLTRPQPHPHTPIAHIEHGEYTDHHEQAPHVHRDR